MTSNSSKDLTRQTKTGKIHCQQTDTTKKAKEAVLQAEEIRIWDGNLDYYKEEKSLENRKKKDKMRLISLICGA